MANQEHFEMLKQGVEIWNKWRKEHPEVLPDLSNADLSRTNLSGADLSYACLTFTSFQAADLSETDLSHTDLSNANFQTADLWGADFRFAYLSNTNLTDTNLRKANLKEVNLRNINLSGANLSRANLSKANLSEANLTNSNLSFADLSEANLKETDLSDADLSNADLSHAELGTAYLGRAKLVGTNMTNANMEHCRVYGIAAWDVKLEGAIQTNLVITLPDQPTITVDNLEVAQFIYLLLINKRIRDVIDTITSKVVLILGRFTHERRAVLDAIRNELRKRNYLPVLFDFEKPANRDITETVSTLAHLARFVIADLTDAKSIPQELMIIVPNLPSVPVQPLILSSQSEYGMFEHFTRFPWVLPVYHYTDQASLLQSLKGNVIDPAEKMAQELANRLH